MTEVFTGDDWEISVTLKRSGVVYDVSTATDISAAIVSSNDDSVTTVIAAISQSALAAGANWGAGVVVVEIPAASTGITDYGQKYIEIQVTIGGKKITWPRIPITVKKGIIA